MKRVTFDTLLILALMTNSEHEKFISTEYNDCVKKIIESLCESLTKEYKGKTVKLIPNKYLDSNIVSVEVNQIVFYDGNYFIDFLHCTSSQHRHRLKNLEFK